MGGRGCSPHRTPSWLLLAPAPAEAPPVPRMPRAPGTADRPPPGPPHSWTQFGLWCLRASLGSPPGPGLDFGAESSHARPEPRPGQGGVGTSAPPLPSCASVRHRHRGCVTPGLGCISTSELRGRCRRPRPSRWPPVGPATGPGPRSSQDVQHASPRHRVHPQGAWSSRPEHGLRNRLAGACGMHGSVMAFATFAATVAPRRDSSCVAVSLRL